MASKASWKRDNVDPFHNAWNHPWVVRTAGLLPGGWLWEAQCQQCGETTSGEVATLDDLTLHELSSQSDMPCVPRSATGEFIQRRRSARAMGKRTGRFDILAEAPLGKFSLDGDRGRRHYEVAVDASADNDWWAWGAVTGAGWAFGGALQIHEVPSVKSNYREVLAIVHAMYALPEGPRYLVFNDSKSAVEAFRGKVGWVHPDLRSKIGDVRRNHNIRMKWAPRRSDEMMMAADWIARSVRQHGHIGDSPHITQSMTWINQLMLRTSGKHPTTH